MIVFFTFKGKGVLIPVYILVSLIVTAIISGELSRNVGGIFVLEKYNALITIAIGILISALWTLLTSDDYCKGSDGKKVKVDLDNRFFGIKMKYVSYSLFIIGFILLVVGMAITITNAFS